MGDFSFNVDDAPDDDEFGPIPAGRYVMEITEATVKDNQAGTGQNLALVLQVLEGEYKGRQVWEYLAFKNPNETAQKIAQRNIAAICRACGKQEVSDSSELMRIPMTVTLAVEQPKPGSQYGPSNRPKKYAPVTDSSPF